MAKKNNPKAEKAKRNLEYARLHKKRSRPAGRFSRGPRPAPAPAPAAAPAAAPSGESAGTGTAPAAPRA